MGNGVGHGLLLLAGILIARYLGRDLYGEYGVVKTNMFYMAGFSTFGLVYTSTRYIAKYIKSEPERIAGIINTCTKITFCFSAVIGLCITLLAGSIEEWLGTEGLTNVLRALSVIIVLKALASTSTGILAGLGLFDKIAKGTVISGLVMLVVCVPLTYIWGLYGALAALLLSQVVQTAYNYRLIHEQKKRLPIYYKNENGVREMLKFSTPVALQEISYGVCNWAAIMLLTRLSSVGEVGLYTASAQWNAVIVMIPGILSNVALTHLSSLTGDVNKKMTEKILGINICITAVPLVIVYCCIPIIVSFYGKQFAAMTEVMQITLLMTLPECCSSVLKSELISIGRVWPLFILRFIRDLMVVCGAYFLLTLHSGIDGAYYFGLSSLTASCLFFVGCYILFKIYSSKAEIVR